MDPYEVELQRLQNLYDDVPTDTEYDDAEFDSEPEADADYIVSDHTTDTEQEDLPEDEDSVRQKSIPVSDERRLFYRGKDGTKWKKHVPPRNVRTRKENKVTTKVPAVIGDARNATDPYQSWMYMFRNIIDVLVKYTNIYIQNIQGKYKSQYDCKPTNVEEIKAFMGLLYLAGVQHGGRKNVSEFWAQDGMGCEIFVATMAQRRFEFLVKCLRFDDINTREIRKQEDKLAAVREMCDIFVRNCKANYTVGEYVTLDEMLFPFRGRCLFKMYMPKKPNKYGLKVFATVEARTFYTHHIELYAGMQPDGPFKISNSTADVTERMVQHLSGSGRNVTMGCWFTSHHTVTHLLDTHRLTVVGTIMANRRELPQELTNVKNRQVNSSMFAYGDKMTLVSYVPKKSKNVLVVSSMHRDDKIDESTGDRYKPDMITFYNSTKSGVDVVDRMIASYTVARGTRRWPMVIFYGLANIAAINAFIIYRANNPDAEFSTSRRLFQKSLGIALVQDNMKMRALQSNIPRSSRLLAVKFSGTEQTEEDPRPGKRGNCRYCKRRKTRYFCRFCKNWLCMEHIQACCAECIEKING